VTLPIVPPGQAYDEMLLFAKVISGVCLLHLIFISDILSDVIGMISKYIADTALFNCQAILPRLTNAENWGRFFFIIHPVCILIGFVIFITVIHSHSSHMCVMNHNWSAKKHSLRLQSAAGISRDSALSEERIRQCGTSFLSLVARKQISDCKLPFSSAGTAVSLFGAKTVIH